MFYTKAGLRELWYECQQQAETPEECIELFRKECLTDERNLRYMEEFLRDLPSPIPAPQSPPESILPPQSVRITTVSENENQSSDTVAPVTPESVQIDTFSLNKNQSSSLNKNQTSPVHETLDTGVDEVLASNSR